MKKTISYQLRAYMERNKEPDEQILAVEKQRGFYWTKISLLLLELALPAIMVAIYYVLPPVYFFICAPCFTAMFVAIFIHFPTYLLRSTYLAVTDKAIYYCTDLLATNVYKWCYREIASVECTQKKINIHSIYSASEQKDRTSAKTIAASWKNLFLALMGRPLTYRLFSLTQLYEFSVKYKRSIGGSYRYSYDPSADFSHLQLSFDIRSDSALRDAFTKAVKKNPCVRIGYDNRPIE